MEEQLESERILCAIKNPTDRNNQSRFYNDFLKRNRKHRREDLHEKKINWLMLVTSEDIDILEELGCEIIKIADNIEIEEEDDTTREYKKGFKILFNLFNKAMNDSKVKNTMRKLLSDDNGMPNNDYKKIIQINEMMTKNEQ